MSLAALVVILGIALAAAAAPVIVPYDPDEPDAVARHLTDWAWIIGTQSAPKGPDDDPEFLRMLSRAIDGDPPAGEEA